MIRSMTGYGEAEREGPDGVLRVELRSVNHRHFSPRVRTPPGFDRFEPRIEGWLRGFVARGHVHYTLTVDRGAGEATVPPVELDVARARAYRRVLEELRVELDVPGSVDLGLLAGFRGLFREREPEELESAADEELLREVTQAACRELVRTRTEEGHRLEADLRGRIDAMEETLGGIEARAPERLTRERDRLREAIRELLEGAEPEEERLAREVAHLAERWDINEEVVRLRSHLDLFRETLDREDGGGVGKRLGFIVQEIHRETNTIGAKANDTGIAHAVVAMKEEVERLREQLENVE